MIQTYPTLYKRGVRGEVRIWSMEREDEKHRVVSGIEGGALTRAGWTVCEAKNVGRSNATTPETQAQAEVEAEYVKKLDRGYFKDVADIDRVPFTKPMLAVDWEKRKDKVDFAVGIWCQPKLDGIRCIARADGLWTRQGKRIVAVPHVFEALTPFFDRFPDAILDGELYNHDLREDFNAITSAVRKTKPKAEDFETAKVIQYHVYDWVGSEDFVSRSMMIQNFLPKCATIRHVEVGRALSEEGLDSLYHRWLELGYEGQMVRIGGYGYEHKRSNSLLKRKEFLTEEFPVIAVHEGEGNWRGYVKRFTVRLPDGRECGAGVRGDQAKLRALLESGETPHWATVRFFNPTPDGMPRFPVVTDYGFGMRED